MKRTIDWQSIHSMSACDLEEYKALEGWCELLSEERGRDLRILEVGSYYGRSTGLLAQFGTVLAIDLWGNVESGLDHPELIGGDSFVDFIKTVKRFDLIDRVLPIVATSGCLHFLPDMFCDIVFLDASHLYENVKKDLFNVQRHVVQGGMLCCHDFQRPSWGYPPLTSEEWRTPHDPWEGVSRAVLEFMEEDGWKIYQKVRGIVSLVRR